MRSKGRLLCCLTVAGVLQCGGLQCSGLQCGGLQCSGLQCRAGCSVVGGLQLTSSGCSAQSDRPLQHTGSDRQTLVAESRELC